MKEKRLGNNPYVTKGMHGPAARAYGEQGIYYDEYRDADQRPVKRCPDGFDAFYRPSVGTYICQGHDQILRSCVELRGTTPTNGYDYDNQAGIVDGVYQDCNHPITQTCDCYGRKHKGELAPNIH